MITVENLLVSPRATIKEAMRKLDESGMRILFAVGEDSVMEGVITDGDIRRHILRDGGLQDTIETCINRTPVSIQEGYDTSSVKELMLTKHISVIPVLDEAGRAVDFAAWEQVFGARQAPRHGLDVPVVIMAGGKGTRLDPFTKILPKPLIPVGDKPIVEHIMDRFHAYGATDFYLTVNYKGEMIKSYFDNTELPYNVHYVWEREFMGTAGSLRLLPGGFPETFILSNCDVVIEADYASLVEHHRNGMHPLTMVGSIQHYKIPYGVISLDGNGLLTRIEEKPEYDLMVNTGLYVVDRAAVELIPGGREFHMTDLAAALMERGQGVSVYPVGEKAYMDIGQWEEYRKNINRFITD